MKDINARMLGAVLAGEGLQGISDLALGELGEGAVAIALPSRGLFARAPKGDVSRDLLEFAGGLIVGRDPVPPEPVRFWVPITAAGREPIGAVLVLGPKDGDGLPVDRREVASAAALATLAALAVADGHDEPAHEARATFVEDLRSGELTSAEVLRDGAKLGCDLDHGGLVLLSDIRSAQPRAAAALIEGEWPGALAEPVGERIYALLPSAGSAPDACTADAEALSVRLRAHGPTALSSHYADPGDLHRAVREAELILDLVRRDGRMAERIATAAGDGVYRLLFRAMVSDPDEIGTFYEETVAPLVRHDREYKSNLLGTLETYLEHDCNMNSTARAIRAHRHTVAYRLERVRELCQLDPASGADRERLGLGVKVYRILEPSLPR